MYRYFFAKDTLPSRRAVPGLKTVQIDMPQSIPIAAIVLSDPLYKYKFLTWSSLN